MTSVLPRPLLSTDMTCHVHIFLYQHDFCLVQIFLCQHDLSPIYFSPVLFSLPTRPLSCIDLPSPFLSTNKTSPPVFFSLHDISLVCISFCTNTTSVLCQSFCHRYHSSTRVPLYQRVHASHTDSHSPLLCSQDSPSPQPPCRPIYQYDHPSLGFTCNITPAPTHPAV